MNTKNVFHSPKDNKSPVLKKTSSLSALMQLIKFPDLNKVSTPHLGNKFFIDSQSPALNLKLDRRPTHSLTTFSYSKAAGERSSIRKHTEQRVIKEDTSNIKKETLQAQEKEVAVEVQEFSQKYPEHQISITPANSFEEKPENRLSIDTPGNKPGQDILYKDEQSPQIHKSSLEFLPKDEMASRKKKKRQDYFSKGEINLSKKGLTDDTRSLVNTLNEIKEQLSSNKELLEIEQKKSGDLENKVISLNTKISEDGIIIKNYEEKFNHIVKTNSMLKGQVEEVNKKMQGELNKSEKEIVRLKEELNIKTIELEECGVLHAKAEYQRRRYADTVREYESEIITIKDEKNALSLQVLEANAANSRIMEKMVMQNKKLTKMEVKCKEADTQQSLIKTLNGKIIELDRENTILKEKMSDDLRKFNNKRMKWKELNSKQNEIIFDLKNSISKEKYSLNTKIAEAFKNKRSSTISDPQSGTNITQETIFKMQGKISELEQNILNLQAAREKSNKTVDYYKGLLENKSHIISRLEEKMKKNEICIDESMKEEILEVRKVVEHLEHSLEENLSDLNCQKCKSGKAVEYLIEPCQHLLCRTCMTYDDCCPICNNLARIHEFSILRIIMERSTLQYKILKKIVNSSFFSQ